MMDDDDELDWMGESGIARSAGEGRGAQEGQGTEDRGSAMAPAAGPPTISKHEARHGKLEEDVSATLPSSPPPPPRPLILSLSLEPVSFRGSGVLPLSIDEGEREGET